MLEKLLNKEAIQFGDAYRLRLFESVDINHVVKMLSNPNVQKYLYFADEGREEIYKAFFTPVAKSMEEAIKNKQKPDSLTLTILDQNNQFVGLVGAVALDFIPGVYELGYQLRETYWRRGIATQAAEILLQILRQDYNAHKVQADFYGQNVGSQKVSEKIGLKAEGRLKNYYKTKDGFDDKVIYGLALG
ncbi:MAG: GNAT family N-acetyltransferase [Alphaproteobacteria bacterium]